jgi:uncharacterized protein YjbJ (UPF0337 family)
MDKNIIQGKWKEIKGDLRKMWGNITDDEWEQTKGDATAIAGVLQKRYGYAKDDATQRVSKVMDKYLSEQRDDLAREDEIRH